MFPPRTFLLTTLAMIAFAGNSLLCKLALKQSGVDAASFTSIRMVSGAVALCLVVRLRGGKSLSAGNFPSALALFAYAAAFSFAYLTLPAATGALLLFGAVQVTMVGHGLCRGERLAGRQTIGLAFALGGVVLLMLPGLAAPPLRGSLLMLGAGFAWGIYSLRGKGGGDATCVTAGNFLRAVPMALLLCLFSLPWHGIGAVGFCYALCSGAFASGIGYALWYGALPGLKATSAATVQLSVPVLAALGAVLLLGEEISARLVIASVAVLGGIFLVIARRVPFLGEQPETAVEKTGS